MAKLFHGANVSLDGYIDHDKFAPDSVLFRHFIESVGSLSGSIYGRRLYEIMRYWDEDDSSWGGDERAFADAWRRQHKWVASRSLKSVGPNATLLGDDVEAEVRRLKQELTGTLEIGGSDLAASLAAFGLIDEYHIYFHPVVLGGGTPFFARVRSRLRLIAHERIGEDAVRLTYVPV